MKNPHLFSALEAFCKAALPLYNFAPHLLTVEHLLQRAGLYDPVVAALNQDEVIGKHLGTIVGTRCGGTRLESIGIIRVFLMTLLRGMKGVDFQDGFFEKTYEAFESFFHTDKFTYRFFAPVTGLKLEVDKVEIGPRLAIVRITQQEREELLSGIPAFYPMNSTATTNESAFELFEEFPKIAGDSDIPVQEHPLESVRRTFSEIVSAMRVFKPGSLAFNHIWMQNTTFPLEGMGPTHNPYSAPRFFDSYALSPNDIPGFLRFWHIYKRAIGQPLKRIPVSIRRFNFGYERYRPEDRLVDYMIAFEGLLVGDLQELRYKLALRGSTLLAKDSASRKAIYAELSEAYHQRSKVAHGGSHKERININGQQVSFDELVNKTQEHLREAIKKFLAMCGEKTEDDIIKELEDKIISGRPIEEATSQPPEVSGESNL